MSLWGARQIDWRQFRGICPDVDPAELPEHLAADGSNVDFDGETVRKRLGQYPYNEQGMGTSGGVLGLYAYYPQGATRKLLLAVGTAVYADLNADGDFVDAGEVLASGLTAGAAWADFVQHRQTVYFGNHRWGLYRWRGSGTAALVTNLTAPGAAPTLSLASTVLEDFETAAGWTSSDGSLTAADATDPAPREGSKALRLRAATSAAKGQHLRKAFSAGATVDLSEGEFLELWVYGERLGVQFAVGVYENGQSTAGPPTWKNFPVFRIGQQRRKRWFQIRIPLASIPPASRTASPGLALRFIDDGGRGFNPDLDLFFDDCRLVGAFTPDLYSYYYTYYDSGTLQESEPSPVGEIRVDAGVPVSGLQVGVTQTAQLASDGSGVDKIRIYRKRKDGVDRLPRLVKEVANATATATDALNDGELALLAAQGLAPYLVANRDDPPPARTYALVNSRLLAGGVTVAAVDYPQRVWVSRFARPEEFAGVEDPLTPDATAAGWFDVPGGDEIRRIVPFGGMALIFCARSVWSLEGSSFDDFNLERRLDVGLDARGAVAVTDNLCYFLAPDGVRVLAPAPGTSGEFASWVISEPVASLVRAIAPAYRSLAALGIDERGRIHLSYAGPGQTANDRALVFDPTIPGALVRKAEQLRPGWTRYGNWGWTCFCQLAYGGGDEGQLLGGKTDAGRAFWLHRDGSNTALEDDYTADGVALGDVAVAAGAQAMWHFNEGAGNLLDHVGGVYNLPVDALVTREVAALNHPDLKAYTFPVHGSGSAPTYGHVVGSRPSWNGLHGWCVEVLIRFGALPSATRYAVELRTAGGFTLAALYRNNGGDVQCAINPTGTNDGRTLVGSENVGADWFHIVWGYDGGRHKAYVDGVEVVNVDLGAGDLATQDSGTWQLGFGGLVDTNGFGLPCSIDFASIYGSMLSPAEILNHAVLAGV